MKNEEKSLDHECKGTDNEKRNEVTPCIERRNLLENIMRLQHLEELSKEERLPSRVSGNDEEP